MTGIDKHSETVPQRFVLRDLHKTQAGAMSRRGKRELQPDVGAIVGNYRLVRRLGEGMFGRVFVAERTDVPEHRVAMKIMTRAVYAGRDVERELSMLAAAGHPNIVQLKDHGVTADLVWLTMPLYQGETLAERLSRGPLGLREAYEIFLPVARGVEALHERGLRHQDIKPENIFLAQFSGRTHPVLLDLGVAAPCRSRFVAGTVMYCSPEQAMALGGLASAAELSEKMDTYCLATTLLAALGGGDGLAGGNEASVTPLDLANLFERREQEPLPDEALPDLTGEPRRRLRAALRAWLKRDPDERPSVTGLADGLDVLLEQEREAARSIELQIARQKNSLRRVRAMLGTLALFGAGAALFTFSKRQTLRLASELERARAKGAEQFDKLDTCVAAHELTRRRADRCEDERKSEQKEHSRALADIAAGNESAAAALERRIDGLRVKLRACEDESDKSAAACASDKHSLEDGFAKKSAAFSDERGRLVARERELEAKQAELERAQAGMAEERDQLRSERDDARRQREESKKRQSACEASLGAANLAKDGLKGDLHSCTAARDRCISAARAAAAAASPSEPAPTVANAEAR